MSFCLVIFLQYIYIYIYTYHKHYNRSYFSRPYSHFYIHVIYLFSIIYFMFTSYRPCFLTLTPDWLISYLVSHFNLSFCIYNFVHNTVSGQLPPGQLPPGQLPPDKYPPDNYPPRTNTPRTFTPPLRNFSSTYLGILCTYILHILFFLEESNIHFMFHIINPFVYCK